MDSDFVKKVEPNQARMEQDKRTQPPANDNEKHSWDTSLQYGGTMDRLTEQIGKSIADKLNQRAANKKAIQQNMKPLNDNKKTIARPPMGGGGQPGAPPSPTAPNKPGPPDKGGGGNAQEIKSQTVARPAPSFAKTNAAQAELNKHAPAKSGGGQQMAMNKGATSPNMQKAQAQLSKHAPPKAGGGQQMTMNKSNSPDMQKAQAQLNKSAPPRPPKGVDKQPTVTKGR